MTANDNKNVVVGQTQDCTLSHYQKGVSVGYTYESLQFNSWSYQVKFTRCICMYLENGTPLEQYYLFFITYSCFGTFCN
jgi:hypothetical protein